MRLVAGDESQGVKAKSGDWFACLGGLLQMLGGIMGSLEELIKLSKGLPCRSQHLFRMSILNKCRLSGPHSLVTTTQLSSILKAVTDKTLWP